MPELPEVETIRRQLGPRLVGRTVVAADSHPSIKFTPARSITGATIDSHGRRGKYLLFAVSGRRELVVHLGMTGRLQLVDGGVPAPPTNNFETDAKYRRAWWAFDDGRRLEFIDVRRFGRIRVVPTGDYHTIPTLHTAGPEPFDENLDGAEFWRLLSRSRRRIKTQLLSQRPIAGVGNIYADEALWMAKIHPGATRISRERAARLLAALREALSAGIENGGTTLRDYRDGDGRRGTNQLTLKAYGRSGLPCLRCDQCLRSAVFDGRKTTWCPDCQRR